MLPSLPLACHASALLMSYAPEMERVNGIAPLSRPWHGRILLLNHTRLVNLRFMISDLTGEKRVELALEGFDLFFELESATELVGRDVG